MAILPFLALPLLLFGQACRAPGQPAEPSLVLVTLDTTRADHVGCYGASFADTRNIDALAAQGVRFERAYCTMPLTTPSHASMLSGLYTTRHGVRSNGDAILPDRVTTLAEVLRSKGYRTGASVGAFVTTRIWNLDQGFDAYFDSVRSRVDRPGARWAEERPASAVIDDASAWLDGTLGPDATGGAEETKRSEATRSGPWFLWVHLYDAHAPYEPPEPFASRFADSPYDGEIAYVDHEIGRLREAVTRHSGPGGVAWILVGDHGEALTREHGEITHGTFLFEQTTRVPFVAVPARPLDHAMVVSDMTASGVDVMPTALGLLGVPVPPDLDGVDLSGVPRGERPFHPPPYMESFTVAERFGYHPEQAVVDGTLKLMAGPRPRLFDLAADPAESLDLAASRPGDVARLTSAVERAEARRVRDGALAPAPEVTAQLANLGYMEPNFEADSSEASDVDAKDRTDTILAVEAIRDAALEAKSRVELLQVVADYESLIRREPVLAEVRVGLAHTLERLDRLKEAERVYDAALLLAPGSANIRTNRANCLASQGRFDEGIAAMEEVLARVPRDDVARTGVLRMLSDAGRGEESVGRARAWLAENPDDPPIQAHLGVLLSKAGDVESSEPLLRASLSDNVPRQYVHRALARNASATGDDARALVEMQEEIELFPGSLDAHIEIGNLFVSLERWDDAAAEYRFVAEQRKEDVLARFAWAQAVFNTGDFEQARQILAPALTLAPDNADIVLLQANILGRTGQMAKGQRLADRARELKAAALSTVPPRP
jgi:arylsulfatase A-like enzyme/Tfp pilus assembly protein PilF